MRPDSGCAALEGDVSLASERHELNRSAGGERDISLHWFRLFCVIESCIKSIFFYISLASLATGTL